MRFLLCQLGAGLPTFKALRRNSGANFRFQTCLALILATVVALANATGAGMVVADTLPRVDMLDKGHNTFSLQETGIITPSWTVMNSPNPATTNSPENQLEAVAALSNEDVWAVGFYASYDDPNFMDGELIEHWNGSQWTVFTFPAQWSRLWSVEAIAKDDVWAVGGKDALHWDGRAWSHIPYAIPGPPTRPGEPALFNLWDIEAVSAEDIWAVGSHANSTLIEHWDGKRWSVVPSPKTIPSTDPTRTGVANVFFKVAAASTDDVWAFGNYANDLSNPNHLSDLVYPPLIEHWDGKRWSLVPSPDVPGNVSFKGIAVVSANDIWAVGAQNVGTSSHNTAPFSQPLIIHWDGVKWSVVPIPGVGPSASLSDISAVSKDDTWAVGTSYNPDTDEEQNIVMHWDGGRWSVVPVPSPDNSRSSLSGVLALPSGDIWAVGTSLTNTLVLRGSYARTAPPEIVPGMPSVGGSASVDELLLLLAAQVAVLSILVGLIIRAITAVIRGRASLQ